MCLSYVEGDLCLLDRAPCVPGRHGREARNGDQDCPRQGVFNIWRTRDDLILVSDLAGAYEGVKDCFGLGVSLDEATRVAEKQARALQTRVVTTQRRCGRCGAQFWPRAGLAEAVPNREAGHFCPTCTGLISKAELEAYWRTLAKTSGAGFDLGAWCG